MRLEKGDLWEFVHTHKLVITTNIGWDRVTKHNNMGAGMALQAASQWPELPEWYGRHCEATAPDTPVLEHPDLPLIFLPVKPLLDPRDPERSWAQRAKLATIERGLPQLAAIDGEIALAFPGCGNGALEQREVLPLLRKYLADDRFLVVDRALDPRLRAA